MGTSLTIQEAERRNQDMQRGQLWSGAQEKYVFICEKHGKYSQKYCDHHSGKRCRKCHNDKTGLRSRSLTLKALSGFPDAVKDQKWIGRGAKYRFVCEKHGEYFQAISNHRAGERCAKCDCLTIEEAESRCPDMLKGQHWGGVHKKYRFTCGKHGEYLQIYNVHSSAGCGCPKCANLKIALLLSLTAEEAERRCPDLVKGQLWVNSNKKYRFICQKHGEYLQIYHNHHAGNRCPQCKSSKGEIAVSDRLTKFGVTFQRQAKIIPGTQFAYDFCVPYFRVLIEFHGKQHYRAVERFGSEAGFTKRQERDNRKQEWARNNNYILVVIPYTELANVQNGAYKIFANAVSASKT